MGSSHSQVAYAGHFHLHLENRNVQAGEELPGIIHLKLNQTVQATALCLLFSGNEYCEWKQSRQEADAQGNITRVTRTYTGRSPVVHQKFPVYLCPNGILDAGDYSFPFVFQVPENIQGSFELDSGSSEASIKYTLTAMAEASSMQIEQSTILLNISQLMTDTIYSIADDVSTPITSCCRYKGYVQFKTYFAKNAYSVGEIAECIVEVNNGNCKLDVGGVRGVLSRTVRMRSNEGATHVNSTIISSTVVSQRVPSGQALLGEQSIRMRLPVFNEKANLQHTTSVKGKLIECVYSIVVSVWMKGSSMCRGLPPTLQRHLVVYPPQLPVIQPPMMPSDWAPQQMPAVQIEVSPDDEYSPPYHSFN